MKKKFIVKILIMLVPILIMACLGGGYSVNPQASHGKVQLSITKKSSYLPKVPQSYSFFNYSPAKALEYAMLVHTKYLDSSIYPSGINLSIMQYNLDYFNSEDCSHFVSEALIAGGLTILSKDYPAGPADNLTGYDGGKFVGTYGIVGVYRLVSYLAGYVLPIFSTNSTAESVLGYQPIPASFEGSPLASIYYVTNESIMPSYYLSPGDVIADGGVGGGHIMLYKGNGSVIQTDPAEIWNYVPGADLNISFYGLDTLNGQNVSALYIHMPTFSSLHTVNITVLQKNQVLKESSVVSANSNVYIIGSFPDGVGIGNYTYSWYDNGKAISDQQNFTFTPQPGKNSIELKSTGSNGTAYDNFTLYSGAGPSTFSLGLLSYIGIGVIALVIATVGSVVVLRKMKK